MFINFYLFLCVFFFFAITRSVFHFRVTFRFFVFQSDFMNPSPPRCEVRVKKKKKNQTKQKEEKKKIKKKKKKGKIKEKKNTEEEKTEKSPRYFIGRLIHTRSQSQCIAFIPGKLLVVQSIDRLFARIQGPFC